MEAKMVSPVISEKQRMQYQEEGYVVLDQVISAEILRQLRVECTMAVERADHEMDRTGKPLNMLTHKGSRYFISRKYRESQYLWRFIFGELMAEVCRGLLAKQDIWLFNEMLVIKNAEVGMKFAWHQDSGYLALQHAPYMTCWCPLDDVSEENGTISILPHSRGGTKNAILKHEREPGSNDMVGYSGDDPGETINVRAGGIVVFSSWTLHRSGPNRSKEPRRVYLTQYSVEPVLRKSERGMIPAYFATPFLRDGKIIYDPKADGVAGQANV